MKEEFSFEKQKFVYPQNTFQVPSILRLSGIWKYGLYRHLYLKIPNNCSFIEEENEGDHAWLIILHV